ncbi:MAG: phasin family protein [Rhodobacteraceae bacterium]|nr:phasin family protein [Paracoccaceae bacterium]
MKTSAHDTQQADQIWSMVRDYDFANTMASGERGMKAIAEAQEHFIARVATMNREIADFIDRRLTHDRETIQSLIACKTPQEAVAVWGKFLETVTHQYAREFGAIAGLNVDQAREAIKDAQHEIKETVKPLTAGGNNA